MISRRFKNAALTSRRYRKESALPNKPVASLNTHLFCVFLSHTAAFLFFKCVNMVL